MPKVGVNILDEVIDTNMQLYLSTVAGIDVLLFYVLA